MSPTTVARNVLRPALRRLGLPDVSRHCFRRSFGTWLVEWGVSINTVQALLGYASPDTTLEFYVESMWESRRKTIEEVGQILDPNGPKLARRKKRLKG